ncbi:MAG: type II toxin-antitoxin system VapC family toxin [Candidatus Thorarchaeota archaeon]
MILIDSMLWIYNCDPHALEHSNVKQWLEGKEGIIEKERILLSVIIPLETLHTLARVPNLDYMTAFNATMGIVGLENLQLLELDIPLMLESIDYLSKYHHLGIGGRDAVLLATMKRGEVQTLATHDKSLLRVHEFSRIDPVFDPPLDLSPGEPFQEKLFQARLKELSNTIQQS